MTRYIHPLHITIVLYQCATACVAAAPASALSRTSGHAITQLTIDQKRSALASLARGSTSDSVLRQLGKPDEIRLISDKVARDWPHYADETQRWAYGVTQRGHFASIGCISLSATGHVLSSRAADHFANPKWTLPSLVGSESDLEAKTTSEISCHLGQIRDGNPMREGELKASIAIRNASQRTFSLRDSCTAMLRGLVIVEVRDSSGHLLFRDDNRVYNSPFSSDPDRWPTVIIPPRSVESDELYIQTHELGFFPPGHYTARVYFPFGKQIYYASNRVSFGLFSRIRG